MARLAAAFCVTASLAAVAMTATQDQPPGRISGVIVRADTGAPIPKAEISLGAQDDAVARTMRSPRIVRSAGDGSFAFDGLPFGGYTIYVSRTGFVSGSRKVSLGGGPVADLRVSLVAAGVIAGTIVDDDQDPVARVTVEAVGIKYEAGDRRQLQFRGSAISDDQGRFRIANLQPGTYIVRAGGLLMSSMRSSPLKEDASGGTHYRETFYPGTPRLDEAEHLELGPGRESDVRLPVAVERIFSVSGVVVNAGKGPAPTEVSWERRTDFDQPWDIPGGVSLAPDGTFEIRHLPPGDYIMKATYQEFNQQLQLNSVKNAGFASVQIVDANVETAITVGRASEVRGKLTLPQPSTGHWQLYLQSTGMSIYPADVDTAGRFDIKNVPPGEYELTLRDSRRQGEPVYMKRAVCGGTDYAHARMMLALDETLDCEITAGTDTGALSGSVTAAEGAADDLVAVMIPVSRELRRIERYTLSAPVKGARYQLDGAVPGDYFVLAVRTREDHPYFALDFADRHRSEALRVTVAPRSSSLLDLKAPRE